MSGEHQTWSVDSTAYLRNLDQEDLRAECIAVHYQSAPKKTKRGTSIGLRFPTLIVAGYVEKPREVADKIAAILNAHWSEDDTTTPPARSYADGVEDAAKVAEQAVSICDSDRCLAVFGAPEWAELSDDGKQWVVALVKETVARLHNQEGKSHGR